MSIEEPFATETRRHDLIASPGSNPVRLRYFAYALALLAILRIAVGYIAVPTSTIFAASILTTVVFMVLPIAAIFLGAGHRWDIKQAVGIVVLGVLIHVGSHELIKMAEGPAAAGIFKAIGQSGLIVWCMGIGAGLACLLKDRNMLLPIAAFLALFDMWLVFAPEGLVNTALRTGHAPIKFDAAAFVIPKFAESGAPPEQAANGMAQDLAYIGPADFLFLAMFFVALYRFDMQPRKTLKAVAPVLLVYLAIVLVAGDNMIGPIRLGALPALLPIGLTVLWVNRRQFKLLPEERAITLGLLILGIPFVAWRIIATQPVPETVDFAPFEKSDQDLVAPFKF